MHKSTCLLFAFIILISCNKEPKETSSELTDSLPKPEKIRDVKELYRFKGKEILEFQEFIYQLNKSDVNNMQAAAKKFHELLDHSDKKTCDSAYAIFEHFYSLVLDQLNEIHYNDTTNYDSLVLDFSDSPEIKLSTKLKGYEEKLRANGFTVSMTEGTTYIQEDRDFIEQNFYSNLSPTMIQYLEQLNKENKEGYWEDGGLVIESKVLIDRIIWWETFNNQNPDFIFQDAPYNRPRIYLGSLITGEDNTPLFYSDNDPLDSYYTTAYDYLLQTYPNSKAAKFLRPYYTSLIRRDTAEMRKFREINLP